MSEFEIAGHKYRTEQLSAFKQFHVNRRLLPLIPPLAPLFLRIAEDARKEGKGTKEALKDMGALVTLLESAQPFADALATLPDESAEYIIDVCMSSVLRHDGTGWHKAWNSNGKIAMYPELHDIGTLLQVVVRVIVANLGPFISGLLTSQQAATAL